MLTVIIGGASSGKSAFAEELSQKYLGKKIYLATMEAYGEESLLKIKKHQEMRVDKGFHTIEKSRNIHDLDEVTSIKDSLVLLECLGNLLANEMFSSSHPLHCSQKTTRDLLDLESKCKHLVVVTNQIFLEGTFYDPTTEHYRKELGEINLNLCKNADSVVELVYSIPVYWR